MISVCLFLQELAEVIRNESKPGTRRNSAKHENDKAEKIKACKYLTAEGFNLFSIFNGKLLNNFMKYAVLY